VAVSVCLYILNAVCRGNALFHVWPEGADAWHCLYFVNILTFCEAMFGIPVFGKVRENGKNLQKKDPVLAMR
jgi:hypothetical protein